jgi:hypothetical protein
MRKVIVLSVLSLLLVPSVWAANGFHYVADSVTTGTNIKQPEKVSVEGWVEGPNAKIVIVEAGAANPFLGEGKYILTNDGGETLYLVDPKENTHSKFDLSQMLGAAGAVMDSGMINMDVENHSIELLDQHAGPTMHGYATQYRKYRTSYDMTMKIMGMKRADHYVLESEIWSAEALDAAGFQAWMKPRKTGFDAVDKLMEGELQKAKGFPFKNVTTTRTEGAKKQGRTTETVSTTEVTKFEKTNVADSMFVLDPNSKEVPLMGLGSMPPQSSDDADDAQDEPAEEEEGGLLKRFKKLRKGNG